MHTSPIKSPKCEYCNRALVPIGNARTNGKNHEDWTNRTTHKKCWLVIQNRPPSDWFTERIKD